MRSQQGPKVRRNGIVRLVNAKYVREGRRGGDYTSEMKLPEREIQKTLSFLKTRHLLSALQEQGKSTWKQKKTKKGCSLIAIGEVWEVWETKIYWRDMGEEEAGLHGDKYLM